MTEPIKSNRACANADFVEEVARLFREGKKLITFRCDKCKALREFEVKRGEPTRFESAVCECGSVKKRILIVS